MNFQLQILGRFGESERLRRKCAVCSVCLEGGFLFCNAAAYFVLDTCTGEEKTTMYNRFSLFFVCSALHCVYTISNPVLLWMLRGRNAFLQVAGISGPSQQHACHTIQTLSQTRESGLVLVHVDLCQ